jgi:hypothetical protein
MHGLLINNIITFEVFNNRRFFSNEYSYATRTKVFLHFKKPWQLKVLSGPGIKQ